MKLKTQYSVLWQVWIKIHKISHIRPFTFKFFPCKLRMNSLQDRLPNDLNNQLQSFYINTQLVLPSSFELVGLGWSYVEGLRSVCAADGPVAVYVVLPDSRMVVTLPCEPMYFSRGTTIGKLLFDNLRILIR